MVTMVAKMVMMTMTMMMDDDERNGTQCKDENDEIDSTGDKFKLQLSDPFSPYSDKEIYTTMNDEIGLQLQEKIKRKKIVPNQVHDNLLISQLQGKMEKKCIYLRKLPVRSLCTTKYVEIHRYHINNSKTQFKSRKQIPDSVIFFIDIKSECSDKFSY